MKSVYLNEVGIINALGDSVGTVAAKLFGDSLSGLEKYENLISGRQSYVGAVHQQLPTVNGALSYLGNRTNRLMLAAYRQIESVTLRAIEKYGRERVAVVIGTSTSGIAEGEKEFHVMQTSPQDWPDYRRQEIGNAALFLAQYMGVSGPAYTISTACTSSKKAIASGKRLLESGLCDAVIAGGSDALCELTLNGFDSLDSLSSEICNPFSQNRKGINIGEGAALFLMTREPSAVRLMGVGESSDAYHISSPDPDGKGAQACMREALYEASIKSSDVGYLNLHGTATVKNDAMESKAVLELLGRDVPAGSTKPLIGHTLGAAGAQELAFCFMTLMAKSNPKRLLPPHHWDGVRDETIAPIRLVQRGDRIEKNICMSNSFAFGGNNVSVILGAD